MKMLTTLEASKLLGVSQRTVSIWLKKNIIPGYKFGKGKRAEWRLNEDSLLEYIRRQANPFQRQIDEDLWERNLRILENAPEDDEPLTEEEIEGIEAGKKDIREGRVTSLEQVEEELGI